MPRRRTREETRADNDARLLRAGREVFLAKGFHGASLDQVSAAAGLTKGAVYARFDSKASLFLALLERHVDDRLAELRAAVASVRTLRAGAIAATSQWIERSSTHAGWAMVTLEFRLYAARDRALLARYRTQHRRLQEGLAALLEEVAVRSKRPLAIDPRRWARLALAFGNGLVLERWVDEDAEDAAQLAATTEWLAVRT